MQKYNLVLGSASPRRVELLSLLNIPFSQKVSNYDESLNDSLTPEKKCLELSRCKAHEILNSFEEDEAKKVFLITADTIVYQNNRIFEKPDSKEEAREFLNCLEDRQHTVFTGFTFAYHFDDILRIESFYEKTEVLFGKIPPKILSEYLDSAEPYDKAGAYGIQGTARLFIKKIEGCFSNVMGLPIYRVKEELENTFDDKDFFSHFI